MKLHKLSVLLFTCIGFVLLLNITACKKSDVNSGIAGAWNNDVKSGNIIIRGTYQFNTDSTMSFTRTVLDSTFKQLGYNYRLTGKYHFNGSALHLYQLTAFNYQGVTLYGLYTTLQNLTPIAIATEQKLTVNFSADKTSFMLVYPPCGINENCLGSSGPYIKQ